MEIAGDSPPSEAWLFAQAILGRPIPRIVPPEVKARARRAELESLAPFSDRHAKELRDLQTAERDARRSREILEWAAHISTEAQEKLRAIRQIEEQERRAWHAIEQFTEAELLVAEWNEADHPRAPKGTPIGGQWVEKGGGGRGASIGTGQPASSIGPSTSGEHEPNPHMLELAHTWWQTKGALEQARRDIEELPRRIASERAQLRFGGRAAPVHAHQAAKAQRDLDDAKVLAPELEKQLGELERQYRESGYDDVQYSSWTPGETIVGGKGIEQVGRAVAFGGTPAGLRSTGIEFEIASAALGAPAILRLGKAVLGKALRKVPSKLGGTVDDFVAKLPRKATPTKSAANQYEIKHTGPYNYTISGGGESFAIDGYRDTIVLEAKHVSKASKSPYVPGSTIRQDIREMILKKARRDLAKVRTILKSGETPFKSVEVVTNLPEAKSAFEAMLKELSVPGTVRLER
jgi:hypothetical protein